MDDGRPIGHIAFSRCHIDEDKASVALLAPLAVMPARHRAGIGSALVHEGLKRQRKAGGSAVYVLGDPNYYRRFGFLPENGIAPPYPLPKAWLGAWQSLPLTDARPRRIPLTGTLVVPEIWQQRSLWLP